MFNFQKVDKHSRNPHKLEIVDIFALDMFSEPIFCSNVPQKAKTCSRLLELNSKNCSKVAERNRVRSTCDADNDKEQTQ